MQMSITDKVKDQTYSLCLMGWVWRVREIHGMAYSFLPWCVMMVSGGWSGDGKRGENGGEAESNLQKHDRAVKMHDTANKLYNVVFSIKLQTKPHQLRIFLCNSTSNHYIFLHLLFYVCTFFIAQYTNVLIPFSYLIFM